MNIRQLSAAVAMCVASSGALALDGSITLMDGSGSFSNTVAAGTFADTFSFTLGTAASDLAASVISFASLSRDIDFSSITLTGPALAATPFTHSGFDPGPEVWSLSLTGPLQTGLYTLSLAGSNVGTKFASYAGTVEVTPVPEPGTGALVLAGLGVVGFVARRRRPQQH